MFKDKLKSAGGIIIGIIIFLGLCMLPFLFIKGGVWVGSKIYPLLAFSTGLLHVIALLILLPLSIFRKTRGFSSVCFFVSSYVFGATCWIWSLLFTYVTWGLLPVFIGLFIFGVGVVPIAMLAALIKGMWPTLFGILYLVALTFGTRTFSVWLSNRD